MSAYDSPRATVAFEPADAKDAVRAVTVKTDVFEPAEGTAAILFVFECSLEPVSPVEKNDPAAAYTTIGSKAYIKSQPTSLSQDRPSVHMTFAHQIARPSTALSHTCASANSEPAAHAVFLAGFVSSRLLALVFEEHEAHTASHAKALVRREFLVGVEMLATRDARNRSTGSAKLERDNSSGWRRDSGESMVSLEHYSAVNVSSSSVTWESWEVGCLGSCIRDTGCMCEHRSFRASASTSTLRYQEHNGTERRECIEGVALTSLPLSCLLDVEHDAD
jgi:hypothetical protein